MKSQFRLSFAMPGSRIQIVGVGAVVRYFKPGSLAQFAYCCYSKLCISGIHWLNVTRILQMR